MVSPLLCIMVLLVFFYWRTKVNSFECSFPGPKGLPLLGNVFQLDKIRPDLTLEFWAKQYGPVYVIKLFSTPWVVVSGFQELQEILVKKGRAYGGRPLTFTRQVYLHSPNDLVYCDPTASQWQPMKNSTLRMMRNTEKMLEFMDTVMKPMAGEFVRRVASYKGREIDVKADLDEFIIRISIVLLVGKTPTEEDVILKEMKELNELVLSRIAATKGAELDQFPWLRHFGHPLYSHLLKICVARDRLYDRLVKANKEVYDSFADGPIIMQGVNQLLDPRSPHYDATVSAENARGLFIDLLMASSASTTNYVYALINILLHNPRVVHRLQEEIDSVIGDRQPSINDQNNMHYAVAIIYELLRYTSLVPTLPHKTTEDVVLGDYSLPAGTIVLPLFSRLNHDETFWENPFEFRPERFLDDNGSLVPSDHLNRKHVIQFGRGIRSCPGEDFAKKRMCLFLTSLAQTFDFQPGSKIVSCDPMNYLPGPALQQSPFTVRLVPRVK